MQQGAPEIALGLSKSISFTRVKGWAAVTTALRPPLSLLAFRVMTLPICGPGWLTTVPTLLGTLPVGGVRPWEGVPGCQPSPLKLPLEN